MVLPTTAISSPVGVRRAFSKFVERAGVPAVLYIKDERYVTPEIVAELVDEGAVAWIKYAVVRDNPADDSLLRRIVDAVDPALLVSGMGEQPVPVHWERFGFRAFTSGCVCVAPAMSQRMLSALQANDHETVAAIRRAFDLLEQLRNRYGPIPVLHHAVALASIAETGPALPLLCELDIAQQTEIGDAARRLLKSESASAFASILPG
jgi:dihydrodipicolinate synthase/N-acetylneuraminate lyase